MPSAREARLREATEGGEAREQRLARVRELERERKRRAAQLASTSWGARTTEKRCGRE